MAAWGRVRNELERFASIPPHQRTSEDWAPAEATLRAWERLERPPVRYGSDTDEVVKLQRRVKRRQREGLVPSVIYRDHDEESWSPTPDELQMRMIDRAEFDAWPARSLAVRSKASCTPAPPRGDLTLRADRSPRLEELRLCRTITKAAIADPAVAQRTQRKRRHPGKRNTVAAHTAVTSPSLSSDGPWHGAAGLALPATELRGWVDGVYLELDLTAIQPWCRERVLAWAKAGEPKAHRPPQIIMRTPPRRRAPRR
jgi:hypothetical protein